MSKNANTTPLLSRTKTSELGQFWTGDEAAGGRSVTTSSGFDDFSFDVITSTFAEARGEIADDQLDKVSGGDGGATVTAALTKIWQSKVDNMNTAAIHK